MDDILLLPEDLQHRSLSKREIVLAYDDACKAVDILEDAGWVVLGWEPWLKLPDGCHMHPIMGSNFYRAVREDWATYVHRTAQLCRQMIKEAQQRWEQGNFLPQDDPTSIYWQEKNPSLVLYFCLTAENNEHVTPLSTTG